MEDSATAELQAAIAGQNTANDTVGQAQAKLDTIKAAKVVGPSALVPLLNDGVADQLTKLTNERDDAKDACTSATLDARDADDTLADESKRANGLQTILDGIAAVAACTNADAVATVTDLVALRATVAGYQDQVKVLRQSAADAVDALAKVHADALALLPPGIEGKTAQDAVAYWQGVAEDRLSTLQTHDAVFAAKEAKEADLSGKLQAATDQLAAAAKAQPVEAKA
jgi:hypothetical protein